MGSGKYLIYAQKKYGIENFEKEILYVFETKKDMYSMEADIVNEDFLCSENTYNLKIGGNGGFDFINTTGINNKDNQCSKGGLTRHISIEDIGRRISAGLLASEKRFNGGIILKQRYPHGTFYTKQHSDVTKAKIGFANTVNHRGELNSQYGTMWITDGISNKKIKKSDIIPDNWYKGRKF